MAREHSAEKQKQRGARVRVWKSVGAVAIYSPSRAAGLATGAVVAVVGAGFLGGLAVGKNSGDSVTHVVTQRVAAPGPKASTSKPQPATPVSKTAAYKRGYAAGSKRTAAATPSVSGLGAGGPYVVRAGRSADGSLHVIQAVPVQAGKSYYMCAGGSRLCIRSGG
jgi:hypothetical protein